MRVNRIAIAIVGMQLVFGMATVSALAGGKTQTLTGEVSDSMCGKKHEMPGKAAESHALASSTDQPMRSSLRQGVHAGNLGHSHSRSTRQAGRRQSEGTGTVDGTTVAVKSVASGF